MDSAELMLKLLGIPGIIIGLSFHEFAHALAADRLGDPTPRNQGRLTLDPIPHIDIIGLLLIIFLQFGWARPVQVNIRNFKNPRRDDTIVSLAGPVMNFTVALFMAMIMKLLNVTGALSNVNDTIANGIMIMLDMGVWTNIMLFVFNLLPVYPLDGFHVLSNMLPYNQMKGLYFLYEYSKIILIIIVMTPIASYILSPLIQCLYNGIFLMINM